MKPPMKIIALDFDCLEYVLEYLELTDLLNVADSCKRLNKAAELVYASKYGDKTVCIMKSRRDSYYIRIQDHGIYILNELKTTLQLLRCFGCVVSKINLNIICVNEELEKLMHIFSYINKYCAAYLKGMGVTHVLHMIRRIGTSQSKYRLVEYNIFPYFDRPYPNLTCFNFFDSQISEKSDLRRIFPNLLQLNLNHNENPSFYEYNVTHFPHLKVLKIKEEKELLRNEMLLPLLHLNPQLKQLTISSSYLTLSLIQSAVDDLQNIEILELAHMKPISLIEDSEHLIYMKNVKSFQIDFGTEFNLAYVPVCFLPFSFENLEKFSIHFATTMYSYQRLDNQSIEKLYDFIEKHPKITYLAMEDFPRSWVIDWSRLVKSLPSLNTLKLGITFYPTGKIVEIIEIMDKFPMVNTFYFWLFHHEHDSFFKEIDNEWNGTYDPKERYVKLKRRILKK